MKRTPFAVYRQINLAVNWYGAEYTFSRYSKNSYGEPTGEPSVVQAVEGIYHSANRSFIELINTEGASVKSKLNRGILCSKDNNLILDQDDIVEIQGVKHYVTAIEPVMYSNEAVAYEISLEELVEGGNSQ